jgi:hypothetical protein
MQGVAEEEQRAWMRFPGIGGETKKDPALGEKLRKLAILVSKVNPRRIALGNKVTTEDVRTKERKAHFIIVECRTPQDQLALYEQLLNSRETEPVVKSVWPEMTFISARMSIVRVEGLFKDQEAMVSFMQLFAVRGRIRSRRARRRLTEKEEETPSETTGRESLHMGRDAHLPTQPLADTIRHGCHGRNA